MRIPFFKNNRTYRFNPFGGITAEELEDVFVPVIEPEKLVKLIEENPTSIIEFVGRKGRGKTTHLVFLQKFFPEAEAQFLESGDLFSDDENAKILLLDSIGKVPFLKRLELYLRADSSLIFTTHISRKLECLFSGKPFFSFPVKGLTAERLSKILEKRIRLATEKQSSESLFTIEIADFLVKKYKDDLRAILRFLYLSFEAQNPQND